ncbi:MAG: hypothetical protein AB7P37_22675 [Ramlibacter sp.]
MKRTAQLAITGVMFGAACMGAAAQTVYRCGSAYSQAPCTGGQVIDISETLQTGQHGKGPSAAERDAKAAAALERDRLRLEANAAPAYIPPQAPAAKPRKNGDRPRKLEQFTAMAPAKPGDAGKQKKNKKKKKAAGKS